MPGSWSRTRRRSGRYGRARRSLKRGLERYVDPLLLFQTRDLTELIAHEFEHVLEQLDCVDLRALAHTGDSRQLADGAFETARAIIAGQQVAGEVVNNAPDRVRNAGASLWRGLRRAVGARGAQR